MSLKHKWSSWPLQRTYDVLITSWLRQNGAVTSCWRNNDVSNTPCVPCDSDPLYKSLGALKKAWNLIEIYMVLIWKISIRSGLNFAHVTTVLLSWHVQNSWPDRSIRMDRKEALKLMSSQPVCVVATRPHSRYRGDYRSRGGVGSQMCIVL